VRFVLYSLCFYLVCMYLVTDISATVTLIGVKFCVVVDVGPGQIFFPFGGPTMGSEVRNFQINSECIENGKSQRYMSNGA